MKRICVYCSSSAKIDRAFFEATERLTGCLSRKESRLFSVVDYGTDGKLPT